MNTLSPTAFDRVRSMVFDLDTGRVPPEVRHFAMLLLLDTLGVAAAARDMGASVIARETALDLELFIARTRAACHCRRGFARARGEILSLASHRLFQSFQSQQRT